MLGLTDDVDGILAAPRVREMIRSLTEIPTLLEAAVGADLLLHVGDVRHPHYEMQRTTVDAGLGELSIGEKPILTVGQLNATGHTVIFSPTRAQILKEGRVMELHRHRNVFYLKATVVEQEEQPPVFPLEEEPGGGSSSSSSTGGRSTIISPSTQTNRHHLQTSDYHTDKLD